jgi:hypothetical protein
VVGKKTYPGAPKFQDGISDSLEHFSNLPILALSERDFEPGVVPLLDRDYSARGEPGPAGQLKSFSQSIQGLPAGGRTNLGKIDFGKVCPGATDHSSEFTVIGKQNQTFRVVVQPADRIQSLPDSNKVRYFCSSLRIRNGGHDLARLVEQDIDLLWKAAKEFSVDLYVIPARNSFRSELRHHLSVDGYPSLTDELLRLSSRGNPGCRDDFLQPFCGFHNCPGKDSIDVSSAKQRSENVRYDCSKLVSGHLGELLQGRQLR